MSDYIRPHMPIKTHPVDDVQFVRDWRASHQTCAACGRMGECTAHHIIGGRGGRSDEACNLLALDWHPCHQLAEQEQIRVFGELLPKITLPIALAMKLRADPGEYDYARLTVLHGRWLPDPEPIPEFFLRMLEANTISRRVA